MHVGATFPRTRNIDRNRRLDYTLGPPREGSQIPCWRENFLIFNICNRSRNKEGLHFRDFNFHVDA